MPKLIVLLRIDKYLKIALYNIIFLLCLAINLRIKSDREPLYNTNKIAKL